MIDYTAFEFEAVVDWIEIEVTLRLPTQPQHVRNRIATHLPHWGRPPYIAPLTEAKSRSTRKIGFRVQDPAGPTTLMREIQAVAPPGNGPIKEEDVRIVGIEVSIDAYHPAQDPHALADMTLHLFCMHARPPKRAGLELNMERGAGPLPLTDNSNRVITEPRHFRWADGGSDTLQAFIDGYTVRAGDAGADHTARYYLKTADSLDGTSYAPLLMTEHSARIEVTLTGACTPFDSISAWRAFKFASLAKHFGMRTVNRPASTSDARSRVRTAGIPTDEARIQDHKRSTRRGTRADGVWYELARNALRALARAQKKG